MAVSLPGHEPGSRGMSSVGHSLNASMFSLSCTGKLTKKVKERVRFEIKYKMRETEIQTKEVTDKLR
jgi:hypothetical protein